MMLLYPQLPRPLSQQLARDRHAASVMELETLVALDHPDVSYTPTGGRRVTDRELRNLRDVLVGAARARGYPLDADDDARAAFDQDAAIALHSTMDVSPHEASRGGIWEFVACVLVCDVVRWRFPGDAEGTPLERFLSGRRNTFQRLWWRAFALVDPERKDRYELLRHLGEDEIVQIMERPFLAGSGVLARTVAQELLTAAENHKGLARRRLIREAQKRIRRLAAFTSFDAIEPTVLQSLVRQVFEDVADVAVSRPRRVRA